MRCDECCCFGCLFVEFFVLKWSVRPRVRVFWVFNYAGHSSLYNAACAEFSPETLKNERCATRNLNKCTRQNATACRATWNIGYVHKHYHKSPSDLIASFLIPCNRRSAYITILILQLRLFNPISQKKSPFLSNFKKLHC